MMRKILFMVLVLSLVFSLAACGDKAENDAASDAVEETTPEPTDASTTAAPPTTEPGPKKVNKWIEFSDDSDSSERNAVKVGDGGGHKSIGVKFTADFIITGISLSCPSWSDDIGTMVFKIYSWDTDYETTTSKDPVFVDTETFVDYPDNSMMEVMFGDEIPAGTYLWELSEGKDGVGVWASKTHGSEGLVFYKNGEPFTDGTAFNGELIGYVMSE